MSNPEFQEFLCLAADPVELHAAVEMTTLCGQVITAWDITSGTWTSARPGNGPWPVARAFNPCLTCGSAVSALTASSLATTA